MRVKHGGDTLDARRGARMLAVQCHEQFLQTQVVAQVALGAAAPVVEVAADEHRLVARNMRVDARGQRAQLAAALLLQQAEVNAEDMQSLRGMR